VAEAIPQKRKAIALGGMIYRRSSYHRFIYRRRTLRFAQGRPLLIGVIAIVYLARVSSSPIL
jgi:hypothetical protein